jgi:phosphohistidine phosphatase
MQVCLIRRKTSSAWGIPKGMVDPGETHEATALNEAWEEAGLQGRLVGEPLGTYKYSKWGLRLSVAVYLMQVLVEADDWEEDRIRERKWASFAEAVWLLSEHPVWPLLDRARVALSKRK